MLVGDGWRCGIMRSDWHNGRNARANTCFARKRLSGEGPRDTHPRRLGDRDRSQPSTQRLTPQGGPVAQH